MSLSLGGQNAVDNQPGHGNGTFVSVLWKRLVLAFLAVFSDETADVEEGCATVVFVVVPGSLPQEPDQQATGYTEDDQACNDESSDVKTVRGTASISREDADGLRGHRRNGGSMGKGGKGRNENPLALGI